MVIFAEFEIDKR